jgi:transaldolase
MEIWLDTINPAAIHQAKQLGMLHGVTTNPTILAKSRSSFEKTLQELLGAQRGPIAVQVIATKADEIILQGERLYDFSQRIVVKIPVTKDGLEAIHHLSKHSIETMATAIFHPNQALLAAKAGASYMAPYFSRMEQGGNNAADHLKTILHMLTHYGLTTKVLVASLKDAEQVKLCGELGVHAITLKEDLFADFIKSHPLTDEVIGQFLEDWKQVKSAKLFS